MPLLYPRIKIALNVLIALLMLPVPRAVAQKPHPKAHSNPASAAEKTAAKTKLDRDPVITQIIKDVSPQSIRQIDEKLVTFGTRSTLSVNNPDAATSPKGIVAARNWIKSEFERISAECNGCLEVKTDTFIERSKGPRDRITQPTEIQNVYAILKGTDPAQANRIYLVTGHYDSRNSDVMNSTLPAPGANDDGSGTSVSLECARVLSKHRFPATIIFLTVAGEEQGLYGSAHFAKMSKAVGWELEAVLNNDIVGGDRTPGDAQRDPHIVRVFSEGLSSTADEAELHRVRSLGGESDSPSRQLARYVQDVAKEYLSGADFQAMLIFRHDRYLRGGDHSSFNEQGYPAVRLTEFRENFNHQHQNVRTEIGIEYGDLPKFVDYEYIANVARLNAATLATLASAPAPPVDVRLLTKALTNDSTLEWKASRGGLATGYEVLWRDTTAPDWEHFKDIGSVTQTTLPVSKDNVIFAVRAVDGKGHSSLPVVPQPER